MEIIAIHHGLSTMGNKIMSSHNHQGVSAQGLLPDSVAFVRWSMQGKRMPELPSDSKAKFCASLR